MPPSSASCSFWERNLDNLVIDSAAFAALCCLGFPVLLALVSAGAVKHWVEHHSAWLLSKSLNLEKAQ